MQVFHRLHLYKQFSVNIQVTKVSVNNMYVYTCIHTCITNTGTCTMLTKIFKEIHSFSLTV